MLNLHGDQNFQAATKFRAGETDRAESSLIVETIEKPAQSDRLQQLLMLYQPTESDYAEPECRRKSEEKHRQFARCPIARPQMMGTLNVNGARYHCCLTEMSIGGFGVIVAGHRKFTPGTIGSLRTADMNYVVRISRLEERPEGIYVGLKQLEEVLDRQIRLPGEPSGLMGYLLAAVSGGLVALLTYFIMHGL